MKDPDTTTDSRETEIHQDWQELLKLCEHLAPDHRDKAYGVMCRLQNHYLQEAREAAAQTFIGGEMISRASAARNFYRDILMKVLSKCMGSPVHDSLTPLVMQVKRFKDESNAPLLTMEEALAEVRTKEAEYSQQRKKP